MTAPVRRPSVPSAVGENRRRIRILEATPPASGDYVFLFETRLASPAQFLGADNIDQSYRHLVIELSVAALYGATVGNNPNPGSLQFEGKAPGFGYSDVYGYSPQIDWVDSGDPSIPAGEDPTQGDSRTQLKGILTWSDRNYSADFAQPFSSLTMKFLNYSSGESFRPRSCLWQAVSWASFPPSAEGARYSSGALIYQDDGLPLDDFRFSANPLPILANLGAWSAVTAYIVGDYVTRLGVSYVCVANNTNQVPPNSAYWVLYQPLLDTDSLMSVYGIR